jgi:hypothetical protein
MFATRHQLPAPAQRPLAAAPPDEALTARVKLLWLAAAAAHIPLAIGMQAVSVLTYVHGVCTFGLGMWWALSGNQLPRVARVGAYIIGCEILWRMTTDALPWEAGKYMIVALFAVALLNGRGLKSLVVPGLVFAVLLPSAVITIRGSEYAVWRNNLSFNLSGPLALVLASALFSQLRLSPLQLLRLFLTIVTPIVGIAGLVVKGIVTAEAITFTKASNFALSGNFGPNQVSLVLGLGCLAAMWCVFETGSHPWFRLALFAIMMWLGVQSALTFSRGGFFGAMGSALVAVAFLMTLPQMRKQLAWGIAFVIVVGIWVISPLLVQFTGGAIAQRYEETSMTGREVYGRQDLQAWEENPIFGVGPGRSALEHSHNAVTHTEFTRLLAEHGLFGAFAIVMMVVAFFRNVLRAPTAREKALAASAMVWTLLYMSNAAMRTGAASFMFGLGFCQFGVATATASPALRAAGTRRLQRGRPYAPGRAHQELIQPS